MTPEHWGQIEEIYRAALRQDPSARAKFLVAACGRDAELRREVESLLETEAQAEAFLDTQSPDRKQTSLLGRQVGPYRIVAPLGAGGMGEVYRAHDTKLGRDVAIKTLPPEFAGHPERLARLRREAHTLASLNHPNIAAIYGLEESDGTTYLVLELVDGSTLRGPLAPEQAVDYARQVTEALQTAHANGIIHRDLKPANIKVTREGRVKVLDFGLAKAVWRDAEPDVPQQATLTAFETMAGQIAGTPPYMSPEQARGEALDGRSDLWSLGVVLYETLTDSRPFEGGSTRTILDAVLHVEPTPLRRRNPRVPAKLEFIVTKLLQKDREKRYPNAAELLADLKKLQLRKPPRRGKWAAVAAAALTVLGAGALLWQRLQATPLTDKDVLVLADFTNTTGDPVFDGTLREALAIQLDESPFLKTLSDERVRTDLRLMGRPVTERITNDIARDMCQRENEKATIGGSIAGIGKIYAITLQSANCQTGDTLARVQVESPDKEHVLGWVTQAAKVMRRKLGESLQSIEPLKSERDASEVTTVSLQAFQAYARGAASIRQGGSLAAIPMLQEAVALDPNFAIAWDYLGLAYLNVSSWRIGFPYYFQRAFALRDRVTERERLWIDSYYYSSVSDWDKAIETSELWARTYPRSHMAHNAAGFNHWVEGELEEALREQLVAYNLEPRNAIVLNCLVMAYQGLNRFDEAKKIAGTELAQNPDEVLLHERLLGIAYDQNDRAGADRQLQWFSGKPDEFVGLEIQANDAEMRGRIREANEILRRATELRQRRRLPAAPGLSTDALALLGKCAPALASTAPGAVAAALCGDAAQTEAALKQAREASALHPENTFLRAIRLPTIGAAAELKRDRPDAAIELLQPVMHHERLRPEVMYLRGLSYLQARKGTEAAAEFQKIIDHVGATWGAFYAPSYVGLARGAALTGDTARAKKAYQDFLALWKDADPDIPILGQARKEYAALN